MRKITADILGIGTEMRMAGRPDAGGGDARKNEFLVYILETWNYLILAQGLGFGIYGPSLVDLAEVYETSTEEVALMNSFRAVGMFIGSCMGES